MVRRAEPHNAGFEIDSIFPDQLTRETPGASMKPGAESPRPTRLRILQIINDLPVAGAETLCTQLTACLRAKDVDTRVLTLRDVESPLAGAVARSGAALEVRKPGSLRSLSNILTIRKQMTQFDVVHVHLFPAQLWAAVAMATLPAARRPVLVTTEHNTYNRRRKKWYRGIDRAMYRAYDQIVAISDATASALVAWLPDLSSRVIVIPNGIDYDRFASAPAAPRSTFLPADVLDRAPLLLCAGRLSEQKDQATTIRALAQIPNSHLCLAGTGELRSDLEALSETLGVRSRVHFLGQRDDLPTLLKAADIYVQPSLWEGFGLAVVEAMASGIPVIHSDVPGMREVVAGSGRAFAAGDAIALTEQVNAILADPFTASELSRKGRIRAQDFTLDRFIDRHLTLFNDLHDYTVRRRLSSERSAP